MWIIWALIVGLVAGALARLLVPGRDPMGWLMTMLLGVAGSFLGGFIATLLWRDSAEGFRPGGFILSIVGAIILLLLYRAINKRRA
jgi:uncharacterized membrane protein YeaQ/YmgE (transglycosylase-associated protein family)